MNADARATGSEGVPGWFVATLLLVCIFAPYGTFGAGGGTLRADHIAVYAAFGVTLAIWRPRHMPPPLAASHIALFILASFGTLRCLDVVARDPLGAWKSADNLVRGPAVVWVASSMRTHKRDAEWISRALSFSAAALFCMAIADRFAPRSDLGQWLAASYGGPRYHSLGANHKELCNMIGRATGAFVTAPALAMASVFLLLVAILLREESTLARIVTGACAIGAGLLSNSKSFVLGVPLVLALVAGRGLRRWVPIVVVASAWATMVVAAPESLPVAVNPLSELGHTQDPLWLLTSGRYSEGESITWVASRILDEAPLSGLGFAVDERLMYADSAVNRYMLYGGVPGLVLGVSGFVWQAVELARHKAGSGWRAIGWRAVVVAGGFWLAAAFFQMSRVADLFAVIVGVAAAHGRQRVA